MDQLISLSKYFSFLLRHNPQAIGLTPDAHGWVLVEDLIAKTSQFELTHELVQWVVESNDKQRFSLTPEGDKIRAAQGHSIPVDLDLAALKPPDILFHGTATRFLSSIKVSGLCKQQRHHVHLSQSATVAQAVGQRHGKPCVLRIDANTMFSQGFDFYLTDNRVWLTETVPVQFIIWAVSES